MMDGRVSVGGCERTAATEGIRPGAPRRRFWEPRDRKKNTGR